jgi:NADH:ubiquinone oxidoreductase subunit 6 (subunit J)
MPNNRVIYFGTVLLVATVLLWIGAELTKRIAWLLPYVGAVSVLMIVGGFIHEAWKARSIKPPEAGAAKDAPPGDA